MTPSPVLPREPAANAWCDRCHHRRDAHNVDDHTGVVLGCYVGWDIDADTNTPCPCVQFTSSQEAS